MFQEVRVSDVLPHVASLCHHPEQQGLLVLVDLSEVSEDPRQE